MISLNTPKICHFFPHSIRKEILYANIHYPTCLCVWPRQSHEEIICSSPFFLFLPSHYMSLLRMIMMRILPPGGKIMTLSELLQDKTLYYSLAEHEINSKDMAFVSEETTESRIYYIYEVYGVDVIIIWDIKTEKVAQVEYV